MLRSCLGFYHNLIYSGIIAALITTSDPACLSPEDSSASATYLRKIESLTNKLKLAASQLVSMEQDMVEIKEMLVEKENLLQDLKRKKIQSG